MSARSAGYRPTLLIVAHTLTALRLVASAWLFQLIIDGRFRMAALVLAAGLVSDLLDGPLARRSGRPTRAGAGFDILADVALVVSAFGGLVATGLLPWWPLAAIGASFIAFLATARIQLYDPLGRPIGGLLMACALGMVVTPDLAVQQALGTAAGLACILATVMRLGAAVRQRIHPVGNP